MNNKTKKTLTLLLSGSSALAKKYADKHVLVIGDKVVLMKEGEEAVKDFDRLKKQFGMTPVIAFIPRHDISYILNWGIYFCPVKNNNKNIPADFADKRRYSLLIIGENLRYLREKNLV